MTLVIKVAGAFVLIVLSLIAAKLSRAANVTQDQTAAWAFASASFFFLFIGACLFVTCNTAAPSQIEGTPWHR